MTISPNITNIIWSSSVPDFTLTSASASIAVTLADSEGEALYSATLYTHNNSAIVYDMRAVIESYMHKWSMEYAEYTLTATGSDGDTASISFRVLFCAFDMPILASAWWETRFLTTLEAKRTYRTSIEKLCFFEEAGNSITPHYKATLRYGDIYRTITWYENPTYMEDTGVATADYSYDNIKILVGQLELETLVDLPAELAYLYDEIVAWSVQIGNRVMSYYLEEGEPDILIRFDNCFNCFEYASIVGVTTSKSKTSKSDATCNRIKVFYDYSFEKTYDVETTTLTREEAIWMEQIANAHNTTKAKHGVTNYNLYPTILIEESEITISDSDEEGNSIKFSYRYADDRNHQHEYDEYTQIYQSTYDYTYQ